MDKLNITLGEGQDVWFTSDCHFGHRNVLRFCERPFEDTKEMGQALIDNWNAVVKPNDFVFVLGDMFWFHSRHEIKKVVKKLHGKIYLIPGNHDKVEAFELCDNIKILSDISVLFLVDPFERIFPGHPQKALEIVMSHYPLSCYSHSDRGALNFFGHIHSRGTGPMVEFGKIVKIIPGQQMDVGVDRHNYTPISIFDLLWKLQDYKDKFEVEHKKGSL